MKKYSGIELMETAPIGTAGAAWATVAGQAASFVYGVRYFLSKKTLLSVKPVDYKPNKTMLFQILSIGIPAGLSNIIMSLSNILGNRIAVSYGDFVVAGIGVQMRVASLYFMLVFPFHWMAGVHSPRLTPKFFIENNRQRRLYFLSG